MTKRKVVVKCEKARRTKDTQINNTEENITATEPRNLFLHSLITAPTSEKKSKQEQEKHKINAKV